MTVINEIPTDIRIEQVRKFFDWEPQKVDLGYTWTPADGFDQQRKVPNMSGWVRSDTGFWLGGRKGSEPHKPTEWLLDNTAWMLDDSLRIVNYGELDGGRKLYVQVATEQVESVAGVAYRPMITASTSMDGSYATCYKRNVQIIVCENTFAIARREDGNEYKVKATKNSKFEVLKAREALNIMFETGEDFAAHLDVLTGRKVSDVQFERFVDEFAPAPDADNKRPGVATKKRDEMFRLWEADSRVEPWRGTAFGVLQAANTYETWFKPVRNMSQDDRNMTRTMASEWDSLEDEVMATLDKIVA